MNNLFLFDDERRKKLGAKAIICGIDEAGRGPLAGDVFAAGVILPDDCKELLALGLNDSKKISGKKREVLYDKIKSIAIEYHISTASLIEIEQYNILGATLVAMKRVAESFKTIPNLFLVDGNKTPDISRAEAVIKGDSVSASIAAASILAKVARDHYMEKLAECYPQYKFEKHKGYGTKLHYEMLAHYGPSPVHRKSFL